MKGSKSEFLKVSGDQELVVSFGPWERHEYEYVELEDDWSANLSDSDTVYRAPKTFPKAKHVDDSAFETAKAPNLHLRGIHGVARALRNARMLAERVGGSWGQVTTNPHSPGTNGKFGYPIVWGEAHAIVYAPDLNVPSDQRSKAPPCQVMSVDEAWEMVSEHLFEFVHLFEGAIPAKLEGIHEALNFHQRCGGSQGVEVPSHSNIVEMSATRKSTTPQLLSALAAARIPKSCIKQWMLDSGCGCDLVSVESIARLRMYVTKAIQEKMFSTANGITAAEKQISMEIPELGEVVSPYILDQTPMFSL